MHALRHDDAHKSVASEDQVDERPDPIASQIAEAASFACPGEGDPELLRLIRAL